MKSRPLFNKNSYPKHLKIGFVLDDTLDKPDGVQQYVVTVGEYLKSKGHEVHYLVAQTERIDLTNIHSLVKYVSVKFNQNNVRTPKPAKSKDIKALLKKLNLDILHVQMPYSPFFAAKVVRFAPKGTTIVGTFHILPASKMHSLTNRMLRIGLLRSLRKFDHVVAVSKPASVFAQHVYGLTCQVIPNAVDVEAFHVRPLRKGTKKRIVFLGRFVQRKGPSELVRALRELVAVYNINNLEVIMGGKGPEFDDVKELAEHMGLSKIIRFPGFIDEPNKASLLASADIAVFPSLGGESFGIVLVEAMAAGSKIVLAGNNPGYTSVLGEKPELLFDPRDTKGFAEKLRTMLLLRDTTRITHWQQETVRQYDVSVVVAKLLAVYRQNSR